ncbi:hypothetical protein JGU66_15310 [Myxococcaceae bacterium JPH2]|nr:hypothetical protein [Myxococcaceae bacterium JPH2]
MRLRVLVSSVLLVALGPGSARATGTDSDWFASVWSPGGIEIRSDDRVFSLFALLNRAGYDDAPVLRDHPVRAHDFGPARSAVREALRAAPPAALAQAEALFDAHPRRLRDYVGHVLGDTESSDLAGLDDVLIRAEAEWPLRALREQTFEAHRAAQRQWLPVVDAPLQRAARLLALPEGKPPVQLVVTLLGAKGECWGAKVGAGWRIVVGPGEPPSAECLVRAWAAQVLAERVGRQLEARWTAGAAVLREARAQGAREETVGEFGVALLSRALALSATGAPEAAYVAAGREGYFGLKALARSFEDSRPVEAWALEGLARVVSARPLRK